MSDLTFSELFNQTYQLYREGKYAQAFDLVSREFSHFREEAHRLYFWQACFASLLNQSERALELLEEAVEAGYWYNQQQLREDADLEALQGLTRFERLVKICLERQAAAQAEALPQLITLEPTGSPPWPLLLALHGNNSRAEVAAEHWGAATSLGWLVAAPGSSQVTGPDAYGWDDWERARDEIQSHDAELREAYAIDGERVVLGGFSMGGGLAAWLALSGAIKVQGFILVGAFVPDMERLVSLMERAEARRLRGTIIVGEEDEVCREIAPALAEHLRAHDIPCELEVHPGLGHEHPPDFEKSLGSALDFVCEGLAPAALH